MNEEQTQLELDVETQLLDLGFLQEHGSVYKLANDDNYEICIFWYDGFVSFTFYDETGIGQERGTCSFSDFIDLTESELQMIYDGEGGNIY